MADKQDVTLFEPVSSLRFLDSEQLVELGIMRRTTFLDNEHKIYSAVNNDKQILAYFKMGENWFSKGNVQRAIGYYRKVIELAPRLAIAYHRLAYILQEGGQYKEVIIIYKRLLSFTPNDIAVKQMLEDLSHIHVAA